MSSHTSRSESCHVISIVIHERFSLSRVSSSTSTCPFLSSSFPSASCTASCSLSSTTRSSWKACATPPTRGVTTPTTSPSPSHFPPPCGWCSPLSCSPPFAWWCFYPHPYRNETHHTVNLPWARTQKKGGGGKQCHPRGREVGRHLRQRVVSNVTLKERGD